MPKNERNTEKLTEDLFKKLGYFEKDDLKFEFQKSDNPRIAKLLKNASKSGDGDGRPEFIITQKNNPDFVIIVECKAETKFHESSNKDSTKDFAVDGVLHYASFLAREFNVIAVAVSGEDKEELKIDTFLHVKNQHSAKHLLTRDDKLVQEVLRFEDYIALATRDRDLERVKFSELIKFSRDLHNFMRDYAKLTEAEKPLLVSGILIGLMDSVFEVSWNRYKTDDLPKQLLEAIKRIIGEAQIGINQQQKKNAIIQAYSFIEYHPTLIKFNDRLNESPLKSIVRDISEHVKPFIQDHYNYDVIGQFYGEFLRYTGGDKKGLGIVLTPKHITELFAELAQLTPTSTVLDTCTGTAGFLISSMVNMLDQTSIEKEKERIRKEALIGVEMQPNMFALAASNMILRGDGKTNLFQGDCFDPEIIEKIKDKAEVGLINPPYSQKGDNLHEWNFIVHLLDMLKQGGRGIAIVPMSLAIAKHPLRDRLLKKHRLEAVMSMPDDLFYPVGVVTCVMIFTAHTPHDSDKYHESWFGYWKDDGFVKDKKEGRIDKNETWKQVKEEWLRMFSNKREIPGVSINKKVGVNDEWCAEAYLETDYSDLCLEDFETEVKKFVAFKVKNDSKL